MYLQHADQPVYSLKYFTPEKPGKTKQKEMNNGIQNESSATVNDKMHDKKDKVKSFLQPDENAFMQIRKRLSTLTLSTAYKTGMETQYLRPVFNERNLPPRRISSISSRDTDKYNDFQPFQKKRATSRTSFLSDDIEFRHGVRPFEPPNSRASETAALNKLNRNILTPRQNPELFSRQIRMKNKSEKANTSRSTSPKSMKSLESTGKVHLGLIESLDLNEQLSDVEKIKERYSSDHFMNSLSLYKVRGHDRCFHPEGGPSGHVARGTRLLSPDHDRADSKLSSDSVNTLGNIISPRMIMRLTTSANGTHEWQPEQSHVYTQMQPKPKYMRAQKPLSKRTRKKSVGFNMVPIELTDDESVTNHPLSREGSLQESPRSTRPKSILKRTASYESLSKQSDRSPRHNVENHDDEFLANANSRWKFHLPTIHSPISSSRPRPPISFRKKMYHFGDGASREFEQVITNYGNCRQNSMLREQSAVRESSHVT